MENGGGVREGRPEHRAGENGGVAAEEESVLKAATLAGEGNCVVAVEVWDEGDVPLGQDGGGDEAGEENRGPGEGAVESAVVTGDHQPLVTPNTRVAGQRGAEKWDEDDTPSFVDVEESFADDVNQDHVNENVMGQSFREYMVTSVLADREKERLDNDHNFFSNPGDKAEVAAHSGSEYEDVKGGTLAHQSKNHPGKSTEEIASSHSRPELVTNSAAEPAVVIEELDDSSSSDDENTATSAPPAQSSSGSSTSAQPSSAASARSTNGPSLISRPAGLGSSSSLSQPPARSVQQVRASRPAAVDKGTQEATESAEDDRDENDDIHEKLQMIRVKFLRLAGRLGQTSHNMVVSQVLYRLGLAEQLRRTANGTFSIDRAREMAERLEAAGNEPLDFSCTILVLGKTGVGKSATINSIFDDIRLDTNAFDSSTMKVQVVGTVEGIKVKVIDTPGLSCSSFEQHHNQKVLNSVKRLISRNPPDIVLYFDRLDMQSRDNGDVPLLQTITKVFGASVWFNAIVVLTHAASAPPDGQNGIPLSYEMFVTQRSHVVQQAIRQAAGDGRLMNPVSLVENHSACRTNRAGQRVLPNGQVWKPQLLLLCFASKVLAEANVLLKLQDSPIGKLSHTRIPPLPFLLSSLLQSRAPLKLPEEQFGGDDDDLEDDLADDSDSDDGSDCDDLPPFKRLTKAQLAKLNNEQRKAYLEELDYREKLFYRKQLKEESKHRKLMKKMAAEASARGTDFSNSNLEDDSNTPTNVSVPMPDMVLPSSFDSDYPTHRYRFLDTPSEWLIRPVLETQGWDHDVGYEGLNVERLFAVKGKVPLSVSGQLTKDKKDCSLQMEVASSIKHAEGKTTSFGLDLQSVGKDMAYTIRGESRFKNFRRNNTAAGISATLLGDSVSAGLKIEDKLIVNKQLRVLVSSGAMSGRGDVAYGGRLEAIRDKNYPIGRLLSTIALSVVDWHGDLAIGCNIQSQIPAGRASNLVGHANLSNKGTGQVGIRLNSSEHLEIALVALVPIFQNIMKLLQNYLESG
ncbi:translocase of chloroplast 120, chloroplastic [Zea mays]|jgi:Toc86/159 family protein import component|uniref:Translocase of chloroplast 120 chloroplastic n=1 Tax=Zea mays TaxID=4577 RepID=K7VKG7_MAIZE|nr:translocase of chloroplast 120, chloroplastic [Zea mays]XP_008659967.1 translocase of chloroplast 120, chloroplastic [Zea mays]AQL05667.1 Translocase of chloroplast 120 chloroplastic [Zea mays]|eukprot:XP_008659966.1 translocase of chloroplast 120, chloroplastic [Zea mays]